MIKALKVLAVFALVLTLTGCIMDQVLAQESTSFIENDGDEWWVNIIEAILSPTGVIMILLTWVATFFKAKTGIDIDVNLRNGLHAALTNFIRSALERAGWLPGKPLTEALKASVIHEAVVFTKASNPDAIKHFSLTDSDLKTMAAGKLPTVNPETAPVAGAVAPKVPAAKAAK